MMNKRSAAVRAIAEAQEFRDTVLEFVAGFVSFTMLVVMLNVFWSVVQ